MDQNRDSESPGVCTLTVTVSGPSTWTPYIGAPKYSRPSHWHVQAASLRLVPVCSAALSRRHDGSDSESQDCIKDHWPQWQSAGPGPRPASAQSNHGQWSGDSRGARAVASSNSPARAAADSRVNPPWGGIRCSQAPARHRVRRRRWCVTGRLSGPLAPRHSGNRGPSLSGPPCHSTTAVRQVLEEFSFAIFISHL